MFGNSHFERVRELFADQFDADGAGFLYRKSMKGAPVRVTQSERDAFVSAFGRRLRYAVWMILAATLLLIGALVVLLPDADSPSAEIAIYAGIAVILVPFMLAYYWAWNAPARELERRPQVGEARTHAEVRQLALAKMTYGQLGVAVGAALLLLAKISGEHDVFHGWGTLWLVLAAAMIVAVAIQAFRKWKHDRG